MLASRIFKFQQIIRSNLCRSFSTAGEAGKVAHIKHKTPMKRASNLMSILQKKELEKLIAGRTFPEINPGDSISVDILPHATAKAPEVMKGVVIGISNRGIDTIIKILNNEDGTTVERGIFKYHPLVREIKILERAFAYRSRKIVRKKRKLYYMTGLRPKLFTVK